MFYGATVVKRHVGHLLIMYRAICYDETVYPAPHTYDPERFLKGGKLNRSVKDPEDRVFGTGRRCDPAQAVVLTPL